MLMRRGIVSLPIRVAAGAFLLSWLVGMRFSAVVRTQDGCVADITLQCTSETPAWWYNPDALCNEAFGGPEHQNEPCYGYTKYDSDQDFSTTGCGSIGSGYLIWHGYASCKPEGM